MPPPDAPTLDECTQLMRNFLTRTRRPVHNPYTNEMRDPRNIRAAFDACNDANAIYQSMRNMVLQELNEEVVWSPWGQEHLDQAIPRGDQATLDALLTNIRSPDSSNPDIVQFLETLDVRQVFEYLETCMMRETPTFTYNGHVFDPTNNMKYAPYEKAFEKRYNQMVNDLKINLNEGTTASKYLEENFLGFVNNLKNHSKPIT